MPTERNRYAKHPQHVVAVGDPASFVATATGMDWVPTVINPAKSGGMASLALFYLHIGVWVTALILAGISNFGATAFMNNATNASFVPCTSTGPNVPDNCGGAKWTEGDYFYGASDTTGVIGILGGVASILGVVALLAGAAIFDAESYAKSNSGTVLNVVVQFLTLYGTTSTLYIFTQAAAVTTTGYFWLSLFSAVFMVYAQILLYCTSAALDVLALPRCFIPSLAASVQLISAIAISSGDFAPAATDTQKVCAWLVPILTLVSLAVMIGLRIATRKYEGSEVGVSNIGDRPFLRSLILLPFFAGGVLSVYKLSFVKVDPDPTSYMFALFGMLLNFMIIGVVFSPSGVASGIDQA